MKTLISKEMESKQIFDIINPLVNELLNEDMYSENKAFEFVDFINSNEIENTPYSGFWPWTSGGIETTFSLPVSNLINTGFYKPETSIGKFITEWVNRANDEATNEIGERSETNESEYFEVVNSWLEDVTIDFNLRFILLKPNDFAYEENINNGKPYIKCDLLAHKEGFELEHYDLSGNEDFNQYVTNQLNKVKEIINELV